MSSSRFAGVIHEYYYNVESSVFDCIDWKFRHFKFKKISGGFMRILDSISRPEQLLFQLRKHCPVDAYFSPVKWLDPVMVNKTKQETDIMLNFPLFIDVDKQDQNPPTWYQTKMETDRLIAFIRETFELDPDLVVFSGKNGFHIYYWKWPTKVLEKGLVRTRPTRFTKKRKKLVKLFFSNGFSLDKSVLTDPYRILRIPGSLSSKSLLKATVVTKNDVLSFKPEEAAIKPLSFYDKEGLLDWDNYR